MEIIKMTKEHYSMSMNCGCHAGMGLNNLDDSEQGINHDFFERNPDTC